MEHPGDRNLTTTEENKHVACCNRGVDTLDFEDFGCCSTGGNGEIRTAIAINAALIPKYPGIVLTPAPPLKLRS